MKVVALLFVVMMASSCLAAPRRAILEGTYRQEQPQHHRVEGGKAMEKNSAKYPGSSLANHHNIPRQYYDPNGGDGEGDNW
ncbi:hypothetical protein C1H46_016878 [Malus baccata]|uniref:Uncharacterized protein n=1 Tax=Malus baccata TaxID=106549 RepID=A0A540MFF5_MALBA|nr:hypothetical protein C1H46_016878 [Malus baccata]